MGAANGCCDTPPKLLEEEEQQGASKPSRKEAAQLPTLLLPREERERLRPLLTDLEADFRQFAGADALLDVRDLSTVWKNCAERRLGPLSPDDQRLIEKSARVYHDVLDVDKNGKVSYSELATFMLGGLEERGPLREMRKRLSSMLQRQPDMLPALVNAFQKWDRDGDGYLSRHDLEHPPDAGEGLNHEDRAMILDVLEKADVDGDGRIDLWELIAYALGRQKTAVELLVYDVSAGATARLSPLLLGQQLEAIYHTGVLAFGTEWWYGGKVFMNDPPCKFFGAPLTESVTKLVPSSYCPDLQVIPLGNTFIQYEEFAKFLTEQMVPKYTSENYDVLSHNCNSFCDEVVHYLTGRGIPDAILKLPEVFMRTPAVKLMRPLLNRWLGGFGGPPADDGIAESEGATAAVAGGLPAGGTTPLSPTGSQARAVGRGEIVFVRQSRSTAKRSRTAQAPRVDDDEELSVVASVTASDGDLMEIRYFDPVSGAFVVQRDVPRDAVRPALSGPLESCYSC